MRFGTRRAIFRSAKLPSPKVKPLAQNIKPGTVDAVRKRVVADKDLITALRLLKVVLITGVVTTIAFSVVVVGAYTVILIVHKFVNTLEGRNDPIVAPLWLPQTDSWSIGVVVVIILLASIGLAVRGSWELFAPRREENPGRAKRRKKNADEKIH